MKLIKWFLALSLFTSAGANAAFVGINVSGYGNGSVDVSIPEQFTLYSSNLEDGLEQDASYLYTDIAVSDIRVSFNWLYKTYDEDGSWDSGDAEEGAWYLDPVGYIVNGVKTQLNSAVLAQFGSESGTGFFHVAAGSTFGFYADTDDNEAGFATLTISNLSITAVPEPSTYGMLVVGISILAGFARRSGK